MFSLHELEEDASLLLDLKEDVRDECSALGEVTNVVLYDVCCMLLSYSQSCLICLAERSRRSDDRQVQRPVECSGMCHCTIFSSLPLDKDEC